ncbi:unnamed protein product [Closterium sp. NIES-65]|nr:unnamed protein product [Closterium sp. NIES-65]
MASSSNPTSSNASRDVHAEDESPLQRFTSDGVEKKPQKPNHHIYRHFWTFEDPTKKGLQCKCLWCEKSFAFSSSQCTQHLAEWNDANVRRDGGVVCAKVPKSISDAIRGGKETKITARKDKERAFEAALTAVSGHGGAEPKAKKGRMEDWYGEGGEAAKRAADDSICLFITGTRLGETICQHLLFLNMLRAVNAAGTGYVPPKRGYVGGAGLLACKQQIEKALTPITKTWKETGMTIASDMMRDKSGRAQMNILCINASGAVFQEAVDCKAETKSGEFIVSVLQPVIEKVGPEHVVAICTDGGSNYVSAAKLLQKKYPHIEFVPCATHVLDLLLEDFGSMAWAQEVVPAATDMISFIRSHTWTRAFLRCPELHGEEKSLQPLRPAGTRFGTQYITVSRLREIRPQLTAMVTHKNWEEKGRKQLTGKDFEASVLDVEWWAKVDRGACAAEGREGGHGDVAVSASPCERGWATWDGVHTARNNRLGSEKVRDLVFVAHNWKAVLGHHEGAVVAGPSGEVRKAGVVEGNIPTPPLPEGYMLEEDGEREVDEDDMMDAGRVFRIIAPSHPSAPSHSSAPSHPSAPSHSSAPSHHLCSLSPPLLPLFPLTALPPPPSAVATAHMAAGERADHRNARVRLDDD